MLEATISLIYPLPNLALGPTECEIGEGVCKYRFLCWEHAFVDFAQAWDIQQPVEE